MAKYNWPEVQEAMEQGGPYESLAKAARAHKIPPATAYSAYQRGDLVWERIVGEPGPEEKVEFHAKGNEAVLKFKAAEPMTAEEVMELAGVDQEEWKIEDYEVTLWQVSAKSVQKDLSYVDGKATGTIFSDGRLTKEYLYRIRVKLTRKRRIAVKIPLQPIDVSATFYRELPVVPRKPAHTTLFVADPHFGFVQGRYGLMPIHHRGFLGSLLGLARQLSPDTIIWNGDLLDLPDFSSFANTPDILNHTQMAGMECAWMLGQFRATTLRQVILEGNHDVRLRKALAKNMAGAYGIKPVHELDGEDLISVPRFLGLGGIGTEWIEGYPDASLLLGGAKFTHGSVARKGSGRTVAAVVDQVVGSRFFGHIHRHELAQKWVEDTGESVWVGSPGCACSRKWTPGATGQSNWQLGAFLISHYNGRVLGVDHISMEEQAAMFFRGEQVPGWDYEPDFLDSIPTEWQARF